MELVKETNLSVWPLSQSVSFWHSCWKKSIKVEKFKQKLFTVLVCECLIFFINFVQGFTARTYRNFTSDLQNFTNVASYSSSHAGLPIPKCRKAVLKCQKAVINIMSKKICFKTKFVVKVKVRASRLSWGVNMTFFCTWFTNLKLLIPLL